MSTRLAAAALVSLMTAGVVGGPSSAAMASGAKTVSESGTSANVALTWTPAYMSDDHDYTAGEAATVASKFDLVAAMPVDFQDHVGVMRATNPDVKLLAYSNGTILGSAKAGGVAESAFSHDADGRRINLPGFDSYPYLMDATDTAWQGQAYQTCVDRMTQAHYDGCLVDNLTLGIFTKGYVTGLPVNDKTGVTFTEAEYQQTLLSFIDSFRAHDPSFAWVGNAVQNANRYVRAPVSSAATVSRLPGAQMEDFLRGAKNTVTAFPQGQDWLDNVQVVRELEAAGKTSLFTTKLWVNATTSQVAAWQKYAMAAFLMAANGHSYLAFTSSRDQSGVMGTKDPYVMPDDLGAPKSEMSRHSSGAYLRTFANGTAIANPTPSTVTISFTSAMRNLAGTSATTITLPPNGADVLVGTGTAITSGSADTSRPTAAITSAESTTVTAGTALRVVGEAADDRSVASVSIAIRDRTTMQWLRLDGTWGNPQEFLVNLDKPGSTSTTWSKSIQLPPGNYGVSVTVLDGAANENASKPWARATV